MSSTAAEKVLQRQTVPFNHLYINGRAFETILCVCTTDQEQNASFFFGDFNASLATAVLLILLIEL